MDDGLGQIEKCDVRSVWSNEAGEFTPWLAEEENIELLGSALGLELEVESVEVAVGPYAADILAKDTGTDRYVVIENQLGKTDHDHLGKAITYGSVLDASAVVWIATEFTQEHQKALDWLNDNTTEEIALYGVQVELWKIDGLRPAVRFNVISRPAEIMREAAKAKELTEACRLQLDFWTQFRDRLLEAKVVPSAQSPRPESFFGVPLGRSGIFLSITCNTWEKRVRVRVYFNNRVADEALAQLLEQKDEIERELGFAMDWNPHPENRDKVIAVERDADVWDRETWPEALDWMVSAVARCREVFAPRVRDLRIGE